MGKRIIFQEKRMPTFGFTGDIGGSALTVYEDGEVVKTVYLFGDEEEIHSEETLCVKPDLADEIEDYIFANKKPISMLPTYLENGSCDGDLQYFTLRRKRIRVHNLWRHNLEEIKERNPLAFFEYQKTLEYENMLMDIYEGITGILKKYQVSSD